MLARAEAQVQRWGFQETVQVFSFCIFNSLIELGTHMKDCQGKGSLLSMQIHLSITTWVIVVAHRIKIESNPLPYWVSAVHLPGWSCSLTVCWRRELSVPQPSLQPWRRLFLLREREVPEAQRSTTCHCSSFWGWLAQKGSALSNTTHFRLEGRSFEAFI